MNNSGHGLSITLHHIVEEHSDGYKMLKILDAGLEELRWMNAISAAKGVR